MATDAQVGARRVSVTNPANGQALGEFECASVDDVQQSINLAHEAQLLWKRTPVQDRLAVVENFQRLLIDRKQQVARTITSEAGKPYVEALLTEVLVVLDTARFLLKESYSFLRDQPVAHGSLATKAKSGRLIRQPYGVVGIISP